MSTYQIKLPQFEGPFDLLLFFIERDELDIYNIPITKIINEFLEYIHSQESFHSRTESEYSIEAIEKGTRYISEFWAKRWLLMRINNQQAIHNVASFNKADFALSANFDNRPEITE